MSYTDYSFSTVYIVNSFKADFKHNAPKDMRRKIKKLSPGRRKLLFRQMAIRDHVDLIVEDILGEQKFTAGYTGELQNNLKLLAMEHYFLKRGGEFWFPETTHLLEVLNRASVNANPDELYSGEIKCIIVRFPSDFELNGRKGIPGCLILIGSNSKMCEMFHEFREDMRLHDYVDRCERHHEHTDDVRVYIHMFDDEEIRGVHGAASFDLRGLGFILNGKSRVESTGWDATEISWVNKNLVPVLRLIARLMVYAEAFPDYVVDGEPERGEKSRTTGTTKRKIIKPHKSLREDADKKRYIAFRKGYERQQHTRVLTADRYKRNPDGSPREVPVRTHYVQPIGYIGVKKKTIKELEKLQKIELKESQDAGGSEELYAQGA